MRRLLLPTIATAVLSTRGRVTIMASIAERYDNVQRSYQAQDGFDLIDKVSPRKGQRILDLGCGTGFLASVLAERVGPEGKVTGVDPNKGRLFYAQQKYEGWGNLEFSDGHSEDFPPGPYDVIFSNLVLHWIEDKEHTFRNVYEHLKHGGRFAFLCPCHTERGWWSQQNVIVKKPLHICASDVYENIAHKCGFKVEFQSATPAKYTFASTDAYLDWILATNDVDADKVEPGTLQSFRESVGLPEMDFTRMVFILKKI